MSSLTLISISTYKEVGELDDNYDNTYSPCVSYFNSDFKSGKWHALLSYVGQDKMSRLAKECLLDRLTRVDCPNVSYV